MFSQNDIKVTVKTQDLLDALRTNREKHEREYQKAKEGYRILLAKELRKKLEAVETGKKVSLEFKSVKPTSHVGDYDDVIGMLELASDTILTIDHQQYKQYYKNEWNWSRQWSSSNIMNLSASAGGL